MTSIHCRIYRCSKQQEMYLYLRDDLDTDAIPEALLKRVGRLEEAMRLELHPERSLARANTAQVMQQLREQGFFLQLPPGGLLDAHLYFGD